MPKIDYFNPFVSHEKLDSLVNGIHMVFTYSPRNFSFGDVWETIPQILDIYYESLEILNPQLAIRTKLPTPYELDKTFKNKHSFIVFCIAPNKSGEKYHLHSYVYGLHFLKGSWSEFKNKFDRRIRTLRCISSSGSPVSYSPVKDQIDQRIRENSSSTYYQPLLEYISKRESPSLMNYFYEKNNKTFFYHYHN